MEENGKLVQFIFRGDKVVAEENQEDKIRYIRTGELLASGAEYARTYYHYASDEMGSITHVAAGQGKESAAGQGAEPAEGGEITEGGEIPESSVRVLNRYEYDAWGNMTVCEETVPNRFKFNGQQYDPVSQQYYLRARYYNPVIGRFTQEDTYRGDGLNLYAYCKNNPVYYVDPSGHKVISCEHAREIMQDAIRDGLKIQDMDTATASNLRAWFENKDNHGWLSPDEQRLARQIGLADRTMPESVNLDTGTANAFVSQGSPIIGELESYVEGKDMVMTETAANEFRNIVDKIGGPLEQARASEFMGRVTIIPDNPSERAMNLAETQKVGANDKIIFGTGDNLNIVTMTSDAKFVRGALAQGVDF